MQQFDLASLIWAAGGIALLVWLAGGFLSSVGGQWRDRDRTIDLVQLGPWVWGTCQINGGTQRYRGKVWLGDLSLTRRDFGRQHLLALGFNEVQAKYVEGQVMVRLSLKLQEGTLRGHLSGTRFQFNPRTQQVLSVQSTPAEQRSWTRLG